MKQKRRSHKPSSPEFSESLLLPMRKALDALVEGSLSAENVVSWHLFAEIATDLAKAKKNEAMAARVERLLLLLSNVLQKAEIDEDAVAAANRDFSSIAFDLRMTPKEQIMSVLRTVEIRAVFEDVGLRK